MPYSPSVAKSTPRSAASSSRSLMSISFPMAAKVWTASDGTSHLQGDLHRRPRGLCWRLAESTKGRSMPLAVTNVEVSIFLHITAVVVGFGVTFSEAVMFPVAMKTSARNLPYVHRLQLVLNQYFAIPG